MLHSRAIVASALSGATLYQSPLSGALLILPFSTKAKALSTGRALYVYLPASIEIASRFAETEAEVKRNWTKSNKNDKAADGKRTNMSNTSQTDKHANIAKLNKGSIAI